VKGTLSTLKARSRPRCRHPPGPG